MPRPLQFLIAEDNLDDAQLLVRALERAGFDFEHHLVDSEKEFLAHLRPDLDIILSDYEMPQFGALRALELLKERGLEIPFIIISGMIGEDLAVAAMKQGAADYLLKDRLARLGPAITHAIEQGRLHHERLRSAEDLRESEERFRQLAENIHDVFWLADPAKNQILYISPAYEKIWGRTCAELYAAPRTWLDTIHPDDRGRVVQAVAAKQAAGEYDEEFRIVRPDGTLRCIRDRAFPVANAAGAVDRIAGVARDITEQKEAEDALRLFRNLVDQANVTFEVIDPETGRFLDVNQKGPAELGCSREEYLSWRVFDIDSTTDPSTWPQEVEAIRAAGSRSGDPRHRQGPRRLSQREQ